MINTFYEIRLEGSGAKLIVPFWNLAEQINALCSGNTELSYIVKMIDMTEEEYEKTPEFEGF